MLLNNLKQNFEINPTTIVIAAIFFTIVTICFVITLCRKRFNFVAFFTAIVIAVSAILAPVGDILTLNGRGQKDLNTLHVFAFFGLIILAIISIVKIFTKKELYS